MLDSRVLATGPARPACKADKLELIKTSLLRHLWRVWHCSLLLLLLRKEATTTNRARQCKVLACAAANSQCCVVYYVLTFGALSITGPTNPQNRTHPTFVANANKINTICSRSLPLPRCVYVRVCVFVTAANVFTFSSLTHAVAVRSYVLCCMLFYALPLGLHNTSDFRKCACEHVPA